jgi:hypothetical protein
VIRTRGRCVSAGTHVVGNRWSSTSRSSKGTSIATSSKSEPISTFYPGAIPTRIKLHAGRAFVNDGGHVLNLTIPMHVSGQAYAVSLTKSLLAWIF